MTARDMERAEVWPKRLPMKRYGGVDCACCDTWLLRLPGCRVKGTAKSLGPRKGRGHGKHRTLRNGR